MLTMPKKFYLFGNLKSIAFSLKLKQKRGGVYFFAIKAFDIVNTNQ